jgi:hypothetical protein
MAAAAAAAAAYRATAGNWVEEGLLGEFHSRIISDSSVTA